MHCIPFVFPDIPNVACAFGLGPDTMAFAGGSDPAAVTALRTALKAELGFTAWHSLRQVHGVDLIFEPEFETLDRPSIEAGDGLTETRPGHALAIKTADCQPVLVAHASGRYVMALHVGWRGNVQNFCARAVRSFCVRYGLSPHELSAVRGPSLGPGESQFTAFASEFGEKFRPYYDHRTCRVDLWRLTRDQLIAAGLDRDRIYALDLCTKSLPQFFSYRRDKTTGRQASLIWIREQGNPAT
ncbi:polyphenol oxidase family protein [Desulfovibrio sp. TomC]|uniref:polyphenol oxidase family protein n=1 Tax=Desulfovibrio sp. TomC TaxID=1562888 RepID=UPI0005B7E83C|nr:polyphenol oxidase family protein [Desulfovibrio sp. TomC]